MEETIQYSFKMNRRVPVWKKLLAGGMAAILFALTFYGLNSYIRELAMVWSICILVAAVLLIVVVYYSLITDRHSLNEVVQLHADGLDSTERKLHFVLPIHQNQSLKENMEKLPYNQLAALLKSFKEYLKASKLYVVAQIRNGGISKTRFNQLVADLRKILIEHNIDMANFLIKKAPL